MTSTRIEQKLDLHLRLHALERANPTVIVPIPEDLARLQTKVHLDSLAQKGLLNNASFQQARAQIENDVALYSKTAAKYGLPGLALTLIPLGDVVGKVVTPGATEGLPKPILDLTPEAPGVLSQTGTTIITPVSGHYVKIPRVVESVATPKSIIPTSTIPEGDLNEGHINISHYTLVKYNLDMLSDSGATLLPEPETAMQ